MIDYNPNHDLYMIEREDGAHMIVLVALHDRVIDPYTFQPHLRLVVQWVATNHRGVIVIPMLTLSAPMLSGELHMDNVTHKIINMKPLRSQLATPRTIKLNSRITDL